MYSKRLSAIDRFGCTDAGATWQFCLRVGGFVESAFKSNKIHSYARSS